MWWYEILTEGQNIRELLAKVKRGKDNLNSTFTARKKKELNNWIWWWRLTVTEMTSAPISWLHPSQLRWKTTDSICHLSSFQLRIFRVTKFGHHLQLQSFKTIRRVCCLATSRFLFMYELHRLTLVIRKTRSAVIVMDSVVYVLKSWQAFAYVQDTFIGNKLQK